MEHSYYGTTDIDLAATFIAAVDAPLISIDPAETRLCRVVFVRKDVEDVAESYWSGDIRVDPMVFANAQRYLKARIRTGINDEDIPNGLAMIPWTGRETE
jgi:hypothetical protein